MKFILEQFEDLVKRKAEVDDEQRPLLTQMNDIKKQISEFEEKRVSVLVRAYPSKLALSKPLTSNIRRRQKMRAKSVSSPRMRGTITPRSSTRNRKRSILRKALPRTLKSSLRYFQISDCFSIWFPTFY
jgi:hypothetical protein